MWSALRIVILTIVVIVFCSGAAALPAAPDGFPQAVSANMLPRGVVGVGIVDYNLTFEGRQLNLLQGSVEAGVADNFSLGVKYCTSDGHGRSKLNTYADQGGGVWGKYQLIRERGSIASLAILAEYTTDDTSLHIVTPTQDARANISTSSSGVQLLASTGVRPSGSEWQARAGVYNTKVLGNQLSTTILAGGSVAFPINKRLSAEGSLTAYFDDRGAGSKAVEMVANLDYHLGRSKITLGATAFPVGLPFSSTPFSPVVSVGTIVGSSAVSALSNEALGYLSLGWETRF